MEGYIVLCDHNSKWAEKFISEAEKKDIRTIAVESIADAKEKLLNDTGCELLVCSLMELKEYLENAGQMIYDGVSFFEKVSVFVISDSNADSEEIDFINRGCIDFQWRKRNIFVILERVRAFINKIEIKENIIINTKERYVSHDGEKISLKKREADILGILYKKNKIVHTDEICHHIWGKYDKNTKSNLYNAIYELRRKLPENGEFIQNIYGKGFILSKEGIRMIM